MNPRVKELWTSALRSGKYKKCTGHLRIGNHFCVNGVLCDLHRKETRSRWLRKWDEWQYYGRSGVIPSVVLDWAGLDGEPEINGWGLWFLNDRHDSIQGLSFEELADLIDANL